VTAVAAVGVIVNLAAAWVLAKANRRIRAHVRPDPMHYFTPPVRIALLIFALNLPFGAWRAGLRKLSPAWFVAIHLPVVLAIGMRILMGVPFRLITLPLYVAAFFLGQLAGARARRLADGWHPRSAG